MGSSRATTSHPSINKPMQYLAIFLGGGFGSLCRFALSRYNKFETLLPYGTIAANILSCIILGYAASLIAHRPDISPSFKAFLAVGFCGGFSTFSTFSLETFQLLKNGEPIYAFLNVLLSVTICLIAIYMGITLHKLSA